MSLLNALTLAIGVLAAVATWLFLGPLGGVLQIWVAFVAWGCFYHCGGQEAGLKNTILGMIFGAVIGWIAMLVLVFVPLGASLGLPIWAGIVVGVGVAVLVVAARCPLFATIPANVYGFATFAGFALLTNGLPRLLEPSLANPLINTALSAAIGAVFGYLSQKLGIALTGAPAAPAASPPAAVARGPQAPISKVMVGESLVGDGNEVAHIDLLIGPRGSAAETAFCNALVNNKDGFTSLLAVVAPNLLCKPATVMFNKVTIKGAKQAVQMFGPAQHAVAKAVADSVAEGVIPESEADDLFICVGVFIHWLADDDKKIQDFNYRATKEAIARAVRGEPKAAQVVQQRNSVSHPFAA
ncbi:formaldehyde-activating enzyme [Acidibrevibacterium fodinaquatile]|jgi:5,6,7,8-tetrahydromethanopterin hydro-lyase|nr:formaldehyde-activating enzyme [Acidibrevibacterium fodinaquatile]